MLALPDAEPVQVLPRDEQQDERLVPGRDELQVQADAAAGLQRAEQAQEPLGALQEPLDVRPEPVLPLGELPRDVRPGPALWDEQREQLRVQEPQLGVWRELPDGQRRVLAWWDSWNLLRPLFGAPHRRRRTNERRCF